MRHVGRNVGAHIWRWIPSLAVLLLLAALILPHDRADQLRQAQLNRQQGHWRAALGAYVDLYAATPADPLVLLPLADAYLVRGEWSTAETVLRELLNLRLTPAERDAGWLRLGWSRLQQGAPHDAQTFWKAVSPAEAGPLALLQSEQALLQGKLISATTYLNQAVDLPPALRSWRDFRAAQLALPQAPTTTLALLDQWQPLTSAHPLVPMDLAALHMEVAALRSAAAWDYDARLLALARQWASEGLPQAALTLLDQVPPSSELASRAADEAARLEWINGDSAAALLRLQHAIEQFPNVPALRRTQAVIAVSADQLDLAQSALSAAVLAEGWSADNLIAGANVAAAQQDFNAAAAAYATAIELAEDPGEYQVQAANFYISVPLRVCSEARDYANQALGSAVDRTARLLAGQLAVRCNDPTAALSVTAPLADDALADPAVGYVRGAALWQLGEHEQGYRLLAAVCDLAPRSLWRQQAEQIIGLPSSRLQPEDLQ